jgi:hypothetical protein
MSPRPGRRHPVHAQASEPFVFSDLPRTVWPSIVTATMIQIIGVSQSVLLSKEITLSIPRTFAAHGRGIAAGVTKYAFFLIICQYFPP